jgi:peroxiredoxin
MLTLAIAVGCGEKPAEPAKPAAPGENAKPQPEESALKSKTPTVKEVAKEEAAPVAPLAVSPIEDPPVIGTPQAAFNFPRPPLEMPQVLLTEAEQKSSKVNVGDVMPDLSLPDMQGKQQKLSQLFGDKLTVVAFWTPTNPYAVEEVRDLGPVVADRFGSHGVEVVGVVEQGTTKNAGEALKRVGAEFVNLVDSDGAAFQQVAFESWPRTYLLNAQGKVLWYDMEYSRSTRRDLVRAIQFALLNDK